MALWRRHSQTLAIVGLAIVCLTLGYVLGEERFNGPVVVPLGAIGALLYLLGVGPPLIERMSPRLRLTTFLVAFVLALLAAFWAMGGWPASVTVAIALALLGTKSFFEERHEKRWKAKA